MLRPYRIAIRAFAGATILASATAASAQWASSAGCGCSSAPAPAFAPVSFAPPSPCAASACAPAVQRVPVVQQCLQQVAMTEYQQVRQKVQRPVTEVEYIDEPVTTCRPVTETRVVDVPVTAWRDVTEYQTVTKQSGHWTTNYQCRQKVHPCQYDPRPGFMGWMNRTGYAVRSAFTPNMVASREYVPQCVTQQVPVTRKVACQSTQRQTYQVTKYVTEQTTRRVAVNKVRWVEDEVVAYKPVTVVKTVPVTRTAWTWAPVGSTIALGPSTTISSGEPTRVGLAPQPDPVSSKRTATRPSEEAPKAYDDRRELNRIEKDQAPATPRTETSDRSSGPRPGLFAPVSAQSGSTSLARISGWRSSTRIASEPREAPLVLPAGETIAANR